MRIRQDAYREARDLRSWMIALATTGFLDGRLEEVGHDLGRAPDEWVGLQAQDLRARIGEVADMDEIAEIVERHGLPWSRSAWHEVLGLVVERDRSLRS